MKNFTIDNSVFVKTVLNEELEGTATNLIVCLEQEGCIIINPVLFQYEFIKVCIVNNFDLKCAHEIIGKSLEVNLTLVTPTLTHDIKAREIISSCDKSARFPSYYDAIYHAIAIEHNTTFITADEKYYSKAKHIGNIMLFNERIVEEIGFAASV